MKQNVIEEVERGQEVSILSLDSVSQKKVIRSDVRVKLCTNEEANDVFLKNYWMKRVRRSRKLSYAVFYCDEKVAWIQVADPFGTKLKKPLQAFEMQEVIELCRGYFIEVAPVNIESCSIGKIMRLIPNDWYRIFGIIKKLAIVYQDVDANQRGVVYKALGFKSYGCCVRARYYKEPTRGNSRGNKVLWARGLRPISGKHYRVLMPDIT